MIGFDNTSLNLMMMNRDNKRRHRSKFRITDSELDWLDYFIRKSFVCGDTQFVEHI
jgi:hypothetical protein